MNKIIKKLLLSKGAYDKETKTISQNTIEEIRNAMSKKGVAKSEQDKIIKGNSKLEVALLFKKPSPIVIFYSINNFSIY